MTANRKPADYELINFQHYILLPLTNVFMSKIAIEMGIAGKINDNKAHQALGAFQTCFYDTHQKTIGYFEGSRTLDQLMTSAVALYKATLLLDTLPKNRRVEVETEHLKTAVANLIGPEAVEACKTEQAEEAERSKSRKPGWRFW